MAPATPSACPAPRFPLEARILAVADAYEAMTADRVYRPAMSGEAARAELLRGAGTQFDEHVVEVFLAALDRAVTSVGRAGASSRGSSKSFLRAPHTGQNQSSGMSSNAVPAGIPPSGSPCSGS